MSKTMAEVLHQEGAWCGNCDFEGWDACKDCRDTCEGYARALSAAGFGLVADAKAEAWDEGIRAGIACDGRLNPYKQEEA